MQKSPTNSNNRDDQFRWEQWAAVVCGLLSAFWIYFSQPSVLGFVDRDGRTVSRIVDLLQLLVLEQFVDGLFGAGRLESGFFDRLPILLFALCWFALSWWIGQPMVRRALRHTLAGTLELNCLAILAGLSLLSTLTLLLGLVGGLWSRWPLLLVLIGVGGLSYVARKFLRKDGDVADLDQAKKRTSAGKPARPSAEPIQGLDEILPERLSSRWLFRLLTVATCSMGLALLLGSLVTPWEFDVLEYHLQAPKEFFQSGEVHFVPHNVYANMPLGAEMHSLAAMVLVGGTDGWWWGGLAGKAIIGCHGLLAAILAGGFMRRRYGNWTGWAAAALVLASPGNIHVSTAGLVDMVVGCYLLAAMVALDLLWSKLKGSQDLFASVFLVSLLAGSVAACKYPGLVLGTLPMLLAVAVAVTRPGRVGELCLAAAAGLAGLAGSCLPWFAKNWLLSGNPFYPLAAGMFGGKGLTENSIEQWNAAHRVPGKEPYSSSALMDSLQQIFIESYFLQPGLVFLLVCGSALTVVSFWRRRIWTWNWTWLAMIVWVISVWWLATHRIDRFWLPALPLMSMLAALGADWIARKLSVGVASAILLLGLIYGGLLSVTGAVGDNRFFVSLRALRVDAGDQHTPGRLDAATHWINQFLDPANDRLLLVGEAKVFDFEVPIVYATCFNQNPMESQLWGTSPNEQSAALAQAGITYVLIEWSEIERYRSPGNYGFSDRPSRADVAHLIDNRVLEPIAGVGPVEQVQILRVVKPQAIVE